MSWPRMGRSVSFSCQFPRHYGQLGPTVGRNRRFRQHEGAEYAKLPASMSTGHGGLNHPLRCVLKHITAAGTPVQKAAVTRNRFSAAGNHLLAAQKWNQELAETAIRWS